MEERSGAFGNVGRGMTSEGRNGKTISFDDPDGLIGTIGHDYGYVRLETELGYRETDVSGMTGVNNAAYTGVSGSVDMGTAMVNLAIEYSIDPGEISGGKSSGVSVTPYITAGAGGLGGAVLPADEAEDSCREWKFHARSRPETAGRSEDRRV